MVKKQISFQEYDRLSEGLPFDIRIKRSLGFIFLEDVNPNVGPVDKS